MIDFETMDTKKICILCRHPEQIASLVEFLKTKQLEVFVCKNSADFFKSLSVNKPGFALISNDMNDSMGRVFPSFIQRKFKIPVLLFNDESNRVAGAANISDKMDANIDVKTLHQNNPEKVHEEIVKFKQSYELSIARMADSNGVPPHEELKQKRLQRQMKLMGQLESKIVSSFVESDKPLDQENNLMVSTVKIQDPAGQGCFLFASAVPTKENQGRLKENIQEALKTIGEHNLMVESMDSSINKEFYHQLKDNSDRALQGHWGEDELCVLYYENAQVNNWEEITLSEEGYLVPVDEWWSKMPLNFNACLWLDSNGKRILYIRKGSAFPERSIARFKQKDQKVLVLNKEFQHFQQMADLASMVAA
jgi:hypothetical protein